jgi:hypothetical protein
VQVALHRMVKSKFYSIMSICIVFRRMLRNDKIFEFMRYYSVLLCLCVSP